MGRPNQPVGEMVLNDSHVVACDAVRSWSHSWSELAAIIARHRQKAQMSVPTTHACISLSPKNPFSGDGFVSGDLSTARRMFNRSTKIHAGPGVRVCVCVGIM